MALVTVKNCLAYTQDATVKLQCENMDMVKGYQEIDAIKKDLMLIRQNLEFKQKEWFLDAVSLADFVGSKPKIPPLFRRQQNRSNLPANNPEGFYRRMITISFLDHSICELNARFSNTLAEGSFVVPNIMMDNSNNHKWREEFLKFVERYKHDLPLLTMINVELDRWFSKWSNVGIENLPDKISQALLQDIKDSQELLALANTQREEGRLELANFVLGRSAKALNELIATTWKMHGASASIAKAKMSRMEMVKEEAAKECKSSRNGLWFEMCCGREGQQSASKETPHGVNLVVEHGCKDSLLIGKVFAVLERIFVIFTKSTKRNAFLREHTKDVENS
eukprot:gene14954-6105_t